MKQNIVKMMVAGIAMLLSTGVQAEASIVSDTIAVSGMCGMCEKRIESAAKIKGVKKADWDVDAQKLVLTYDGEKTTLADIETAIAKAGHDTEHVKAPDAVYNELDGCCQYERRSY